MSDQPLRKVSETSSKITFAYDKPSGAEGYRYTVNDNPVSRTFNPDDLEVTFGKVANATYRVIPLDVSDRADGYAWPAPDPGGTTPGNVKLPNSFLVFDPATQQIPPSSPWLTEGQMSGITIVNDPELGRALKLAVGPGASGPNASSYLASVWVQAGVPKAREGDHTKYRAVIKIPSNFKTSSGEWQFLVEWHVPFTGPYSTCLGIFADGDANQPIVGTNPRYWFELRGGSAGNMQRRRVTLPASEFRLGATYVHDFEFVWSTNANTGRCIWSVDGVVKMDQRQATLYTDGPTNAFGLYNYRKIAPFDTDVLFGVTSAATV